MKIISSDLFAQVKKQHGAALADAYKSGDADKMAEAMTKYFDAVNDAVLEAAAAQYSEESQTNAVMIARGANVLTPEEVHYYTELGKAVTAADPKAAIENFEVAMPETVIDRVVGTIKKDHPLLDAINFVNTSYLTRFLANAKPGQLAKWGPITDSITKEITGALKEINVTQCKLSAFMLISMDVVQLGPAWMDAYVRETLSETIAAGLELAVVNGTGKDEPIGMIRDVSDTASVVAGVWPEQTATKVTKLDPASMGGLVKKLARDPVDATKARTVDANDLILVVNPFDYWGKVMPATTLLLPGGQYAHDVLPVPAKIIQSAALDEGSAILGLAPYYFMGIGAMGKTGTITSDDSVKFLEDQRAYKAKLQGNGRPLDAYAFLLLDISALEAYTVPVNVVPAAAITTTTTPTTPTTPENGDSN